MGIIGYDNGSQEVASEHAGKEKKIDEWLIRNRKLKEEQLKKVQILNKSQSLEN